MASGRNSSLKRDEDFTLLRRFRNLLEGEEERSDLMQQLEFVKATDLDEAWSNFDPLLPLPSGCPFYVERPGRPLEQLTSALLRRYVSPPKYFFTGYRGSGKSTELNRLASNVDIWRKYVVVKFSIYDTCDVNNLDYRDVLLTLGAQMLIQYTQRGGQLDPDLLNERLMNLRKE